MESATILVSGASLSKRRNDNTTNRNAIVVDKPRLYDRSIQSCRHEKRVLEYAENGLRLPIALINVCANDVAGLRANIGVNQQDIARQVTHGFKAARS